METSIQNHETTVEESVNVSKNNLSMIIRLTCVGILLISSFILPQSLLRTFFILFLLGNTMFYFSEYTEKMPEKSENLFLRKESQVVNTVLIALSSIVAIICMTQRYPFWS
ncbi:MAG: hypothetical protein KDA65_02590 [Planctomycetaceae bacterium]|nr:hypothetical protein [Planctomycetaceae bacterium]